MKYFIKVKLVFLLSCTCFFLFAKDFTRQEKKWIEKYKTFLTEGATIDSVGYYFIYEKKDSVFTLKIFNPDKLVKTHEIRYLDSTMLVKHGIYKEWYDNGNLWKKGKYVYGKKQGIWRYYSHRKNKKLKSAGMFINDKKEGTWTFQDSNIRKITPYKNGEREGIEVTYNKNNTLVRKTLYKSNKIDSVLFEDDSFKIVFPEFKGGKKALIKRIARGIHIPDRVIRHNIKGKIFVIFAIEEDGSIGEIIVCRGLCNSLEKQVVKTIKKLPKFKPAQKGGKPFKMGYQIPITIRY